MQISFRVFLIATLFAASALAQQSVFHGEDGVVAHVVDGDGWQTSIQLNNIDATAAQYKLSFFDENGQPQTQQTTFGTGTFVYGTIPSRGSVTIQTAGTKTGLSQGWALMETIFVVPGSNFVITPGATITGTVLFYRPPFVSRPTEASEPLDFSIDGNWALPFDHLNGYSSGIETSALSLNVLGLRFNSNGTISSTSPTSWF